MKTFLCFYVYLSLVASVSAEIIGIEQFDYPDGQIANKTGGTFWNYRNRVPAGHTAGVSDWDNVTGAPAVTGSHLVTNNSSTKREYNGPGEGLPIDTDEGLGAINNFSGGGISFQHHVVYYRVAFTTGTTLPQSITVTSVDFGTERVSFGIIGFFANDPRFGIWDHPTGAAFSNGVATPNTSYLLVAKLDFVSGKASLYVNPDLNAAENTQTPLCMTDFTAANWSTSVRLGSGTGGTAVTWDDLFVTTTWAELGRMVTTAADEDDLSLGGGTGVSLREAVKYSSSGTLITFGPWLSGQTIVLTRGEIAQSVLTMTIDASGLPGGMTISGDNASRVFWVGINRTLTLRALTLRDGNGQGSVPPGFGGAIWSDTALNLSDCTLTGNQAIDSGGAIGSTGSVVLTRCTLTGNSSVGATSQGGAIALDVGSVSLTHCTVSGNTNKGSLGGGGIFLGQSGTVTLTNSIVAGNTDLAGVAADIRKNGGTLNSSGVNLIGQNTTVESVFPAGSTVGTRAAPRDPKLSLLGYFGGSTMTMHPLVGSPAIDAAGTVNPGGSDQRGLPRFVDGDNSGTAQLDIGAVEAGPLRTVTFLVDNGSGADLRSVISSASTPGTHIVFLDGFSAFPYLLFNGEIAVGNKNVFIDASNQPGPVTINAQSNSRAFGVSSGGTLAMQNLNITNGKAPSAFTVLDGNGGAIHSEGTLSLLSCALTGNVSGLGDSSYEGDAIYDSGGAVYTSGRAMVSGCTFSGNHCQDYDSAGQFAGAGGALVNDPTGFLTVVNSTFSGNNAGSGYLGGDAGAIFNRGAVAISASTFSGNGAGFGSGLFSGLAGRGGAISNDAGTMRISSSTFNGNNAGISLASGGSGGAIYNRGTLKIANSTLTNNACGLGGFGTGGSGGAIFGENTSLEVYHCTITGNFAAEGGSGNGVGGGIFQAGSFSLNGTIVTKNFLHLTTTGQNSESNLAGTAPSGTGNLTSGDPKLALLSDYGGPTFTMLPLPGSPAINAATGSTAFYDQRSLPRDSSRDIGAVEVQPALAGFVDTDSDGMDDRLEPLYGFVVGLADGQLDKDGDGSTNAQELGNKTGPRDPASLLKILTFSRPGDNVALSWTTFPGLSYTLEYGSTLSFGGTVGLGTATGMTSSNLIGPFSGKTFLRVRRN